MKIKDYLLKESDMIVGKTVWSPIFGYGKIKSFNSKTDYAILIKFSEREEFFSKDGKYMLHKSLPSLYSTNILELEIKDNNLPRVVEVRNGDYEKWKKRVLFAIDENLYHPFCVYKFCEKLSDVKKGETNAVFFKQMREIEQPKTISNDNLQLAQKLIDEAQNICNELKKLNEILLM